MLIRHRSNALSNPFSLFDALFDGVTNRPFNAYVGPRFELSENDDDFALTADLPGIDAGDLELTVEDGVLTVKGERDLSLPEGYEARRQERSSLRFERSIELGDRVDAEGVEAKLEDGVLTVTLPKRPETKPKKIAIRAA